MNINGKPWFRNTYALIAGRVFFVEHFRPAVPKPELFYRGITLYQSLHLLSVEWEHFGDWFVLVLVEVVDLGEAA